ncbi:hypothetical protein CW304_30330 [Bacillus sp. UFRGS-B20]|nr:hypothetical protein CW304_30330 [Bacillus sp. UFRGS-B20]
MNKCVTFSSITYFPKLRYAREAQKSSLFWRISFSVNKVISTVLQAATFADISARFTLPSVHSINSSFNKAPGVLDSFHKIYLRNCLENDSVFL